MKRWSPLTLTGISILIFSGTPAHAAEVPVSVLRDLAADQFNVRESAQVKLLEWARLKPAETMDVLYSQSRKAKEPEVRERCMVVLKELINDKYLREGEGYVGVQLSDPLANPPGDKTPEEGILVVFVQPDSPAFHAGVLRNDIIVGVDWAPWDRIRNQAGFQAEVRKKNPGTRISLKILRDKEVKEFAVVLGRRPVSADVRFFNEFGGDIRAAERAAKEEYFRLWLGERNAPK